MNRAFGAVALVLVLLVCFTVSPAYGQGARGTINGSVSDPSGAAVSGAQVAIKNILTGQVTTVITTSDGNYKAPFLPPGQYEVTATQAGFETQTATNITLTADQVASVNFSIKIGATSTRVEVTATGTQIDTTTGGVSQVIEQKAISELPLNGRNPAELVFLAPGAVDGSFTSAITKPGSGIGGPQETAASVNGSRMGGVSYQLDGISHMNSYFQTASPFPNPDATQEFRVITNNFDAQYGYTSGAIVSIATRSGTNQWHGGVFEFLRNNKLNAGDYFTKQVDPLKRNQFGGSLGGPIIKNKLFIFGNIQVTRERVSLSSGGTHVPNNNELAGNFSEYCTVVNASSFDSNGLCTNRAGQLYKTAFDRSDANAYVNNFIDPSNFVPFAINLEQGIPKTDDPQGNIILAGRSQKNDAYEYTLRSDYNISPSQTLTGRFFYENFNRPAYGPKDNYLAGDRSAQDQATNISINHTWTIRPNIVNNLRGGYNRNNSSAVAGIDVNPSDLGANLPSVSTTIGLITGPFWISQIPVVGARHNWIVDDTLSITKGKHSIMAGVSSFTQYSLENATWEADPLMWFNGSISNSADADFLLGNLSELDTAAGEYNEYHVWNWAGFAQDSIKLKPNLNINLGVRWEPQRAPISLQDKLANYWPGYQSQRFPLAPEGLAFAGDPGVPKGGWADQWATFLPRISVAWSPKALPNTTIRSAFAYMATPYDMSFYNWQGHNSPFSPTHVLLFNQVDSGCVLNIMDPFACFSPTNHVDPFPPFSGPGFNPGADAAFVLPTDQKAGFDHGYRSGREETWNLSIQHSIGSDLVLGATYIGRRDFHLPTSVELNPGNFHCGPVGPDCTQAEYDLNGSRTLTQYGVLQQYQARGVASYNAIQVSVDKRFSRGLQFTSNFTYSKQLDQQSMASLSNVGDQGLFNPLDLRANYGISDLNIPRIWNNTFVYQTPKLAGLGKVGSGVLGNWELAGIWTLHSGRPFSILGGNNPDAPGAGSNNASFSQVGIDHADRVSGQSLEVHEGSKAQWLGQYFNPSAFTTNAIGTFGNSARNIIQGPGWNNADLMFSKNFPFRDHYNLQFRWEMFNAFNRTYFGLPGSTVGAPNFGVITSTAGSPRKMQAGLKLNF